ncbi:MAG: segregation/condensation protein A [Ginsengibacter sp.]
MNTEIYQIKLPQFEGPFDLLLFFIERDELDIYNIPITKITDDFLAFIHSTKSLNIELSSEFILFISTLMRIKAKMLLPRKELDVEGNEIDPRQELIDKILEYKRFKEASLKMSQMEGERLLMVRRGNIHEELLKIGEASGEGTEIQAVTLFKLMKAFERVALRLQEKRNRPVHTVISYNYTMEDTREFVINIVSSEKVISFEKLFDECNDRLHAIFIFLNILELVQGHFINLITGEGANNFIVEKNMEFENNDLPPISYSPISLS